MECIIFTNSNLKKGNMKLDEIILGKQASGIKLVKRYKGFYHNYAQFSDGEIWTILSTSTNTRGHRWTKAYVDKDIPTDIIQTIIMTMGIWAKEDYKLF